MEVAAPRLLEQRWTRIAAVTFAGVLIGIAAAGGYWLLHSGPQDGDPVAIAQIVVAQRLAGLTPHFSPRELTKVHREGQRYVVSGWLQAVGQQGQAVAVDYTVELLKGPEGWSAGKVDLIRE